ncbi:hypothetical protein EIP91_008720 [Steccherinum ochraceum]|uniref:Polysaccharide lyase 14 domain-containing protein n=1 Tax=Steccherinum ochraceum TaxID=92696 RepID=A0A4R0R2G8_9APHY|nr:hypothetical protein EIP91_008720 [Steccherinum ochraceum]
MRSHSSAGTPTPTPSSTPAKSDSLESLLFPKKSLSSWSTADGVDNQVPLSDATFRLTSSIKELTHKYVDFEGKKAMQAHYPEGSYNFQHEPRGGISFYAPGPSNVDLTSAKEATFGYSVWFPEGFEFNMGGKLPGLYGGDSDSDATSCSGGSRSNACQSVRLMWRTDGAGEFYTYLPPEFDANKRVCDVAPKSECNSVYGASVGRGSFTFKTGAWTTISERVKLNDAGQENGEIELFVEGESKVYVTGLVLRDNDAGRLRGIMMQDLLRWFDCRLGFS